MIEAAVWTSDGEVTIERESGSESGVRISPLGTTRVAALTLDSLLARTGPPDYIKMDIEGAEAPVLQSPGAWAHVAREITVECHADYTTAQCEADLRQLGFETRIRRHKQSVPTVLGLRESEELKSNRAVARPT